MSRDQDVLDAAISQCNSTFDSGVIAECPPLQAVDNADTGFICPFRNSQVNEVVTGMMSKLPGCITITSGPGDAASSDMACAPSVVQPQIIPSQDSTPIVYDTVPTGQPQGNPGWTYMGCASDSGSRVLEGPTYTDNIGMTIEACQSYCTLHDMKYAGIEFSSQ
jgi:hypothetical protein